MEMNFPLSTYLKALLCVFFLHSQNVSSFTSQCQSFPRSHLHSTQPHTVLNSQNKALDVVLFGVGDLRTTDNEGLMNALSSQNKVLPLVILDTKDTLPNIPMGRIHTLDTADILSAAMDSLNKRLSQIDKDLKLHVKYDSNGASFQELLLDVLGEIEDVDKVTIHTCDLGEVDNSLKYGTMSHIDESLFGDVKMDVQVKTWDCHLRKSTWESATNDANSFPSTFTEYEKKFMLEPLSDIAVPDSGTNFEALNVQSMSQLPSLEIVRDLLCKSFEYDLNDEITKQKLEQDCNTGLYMTHWGGLDCKSSFSEDYALEVADIFLGQNGDDGDEALIKHLDCWNKGSKALTKNDLSLEHHAIDWMMTGGETSSSNTIKTGNLIEGEILTRYLAAPLLFGLVSPRYLLKKANEADSLIEKSFLDGILPSVARSKDTTGVLKTMVEAREWHQLFALKNILVHGNKDGDLDTGYWRWHGFLCRYVGCDLNNVKDQSKEGIALVHGFGASGSQWAKAIGELKKIDAGDKAMQALAMDLIGFGQSEKPSLTYTQYLWESYTGAFMKDIAIGRHNWQSYTIGGNSIGGYTAMSAAADDTVGESDTKTSVVTASGKRGSKKCKGLVLMNSAGKIFTKKEVDAMSTGVTSTVAEATANDLLGPSSPPSRQIAKVFGSGLLWYLRPRIQSICKNLYPTNPDAVDDILCGGILRDSLDSGAINVMISGSKLPPPRTANELLGADFGSCKNRDLVKTYDSRFKEGTFDGPVLVAQGLLDPLNDAKSRATMLGDLRKGIKVDPINAGHCPHDELPAEIAFSINSWLNTEVAAM